MISERLDQILNNIDECSKRSPYGQKVTLVAVSKTHPCEYIQEAYDCGCRDFGENKVQELQDKIPQLPSDIRWHMIGHLQTNKVKYIVGQVYLIHSVDSVKLAREIENQAAKKNITVNILVQVNVSGEESKFGIDRESVVEMVKEISLMEHIRVMGLMTIAPAVENPENCREFFRELRNLSIDIEAMKIDNIRMEFLSMGMSGDYEVAIEEGATMVRIGTSIFGHRDYNI